MNAEFSEFSYGYAMTDNIMHSGYPLAGAAPIFPSLQSEGATGGGYDVQIPLHPVSLFLQFKIPQVLKRHSRNRPSAFKLPYMRMHLRTDNPNQHGLLLALEGSGSIVAYAAPEFWKTRDLDRYFRSQSVHTRSLYIRPMSIGPLDSSSHYIAYQQGSTDCWLHSEPKKLEGDFTERMFSEMLKTSIDRAPKQEPITFFENLSKRIASLSVSKYPLLGEPEVDYLPSFEIKKTLNAEEDESSNADEKRSRSSVRDAARKVAYLAQVRLGCTFAVTGHN